MVILKALFLLCLISITPSFASASMLEMAEELWEKQASSAADRPLSPLPTLPSEVTHEGPFFSNSHYQTHKLVEKELRDCQESIDRAAWNILYAQQKSVLKQPVKFDGPFVSSVPLPAHINNLNLPQGDITPLPAETSFQVTGNGFVQVNCTNDTLKYKRMGALRSFHDDK